MILTEVHLPGEKKKPKTISRTHQNTTIDFRMEHLSWTAELMQESTPKKREVADASNTSRVNNMLPTGKLVFQWHMLKYLWIKRPGHSISFIIQFSSVAQSCPTLCYPMNHSTPGLPVHHQLPEPTHTHVHRVGDAIQPSHPLLSPSPPAPNPSQYQGLFQWVNSSHQVAKVSEFQLQH